MEPMDTAFEEFSMSRYFVCTIQVVYLFENLSFKGLVSTVLAVIIFRPVLYQSSLENAII